MLPTGENLGTSNADLDEKPSRLVAANDFSRGDHHEPPFFPAWSEPTDLGVQILADQGFVPPIASVIRNRSGFSSGRSIAADLTHGGTPDLIVPFNNRPPSCRALLIDLLLY